MAQGLYSSDGGWNVTSVSGTATDKFGIYADDGSLRVTTDSGSGLYAPNGALRINTSATTYYSADGALGGVLSGSVFYPSFMNNNTTPAEVIPFLNDANTYYWKYTALDNIIDSFGTATLSKTKERVGNKLSLVQSNKQLQPLSIATGINFNQQTNRILMADTGVKQTSVANGTNGWFFATTVTPTTGNVYLMEIARNASQAASRGQLYISSSRTIVLKMGMADSATLAIVFQSSALTLGQKYAIAVGVYLVTPTASLWINGVSQSITPANLTAGAFPSTNPYSFAIGNTVSTGGASFDGVMDNTVFYDGIPPTSIRDSIIAYESTI